MRPWIGVDFDGTLAHYDKWISASHTGEPIPKMVTRVRNMLAAGDDVRIFTARVYPLMTVNPGDNLGEVFGPESKTTSRHIEAAQAALAIREFCIEHIGQVLPITCVKDYGMVDLYDDRAKQVIKNTGVLLEEATGAGKHAFTQG